MKYHELTDAQLMLQARREAPAIDKRLRDEVRKRGLLKQLERFIGTRNPPRGMTAAQRREWAQLGRLALATKTAGLIGTGAALLNPMFTPQARGKFAGARYGLEIDLTGRGMWAEAGLYDTRAAAESDGRKIQKRDGFPYRVKATRDTRNPVTDPVTDRARRYRAQRNAPPGPRRCNICASRENVDIDHITGDEDDGERENLWYLCRPCNTRKGITQARNRIGRRTRQYNPRQGLRSYQQFRNCAAVLIGIDPGDVAEATELMYATSPEQRARFAEQVHQGNPFKSEAQRRKFFAMLGRGEISPKQLKHFEQHNPAATTYAQYGFAVASHQRGAHDEGGEIIHATPPALRHKYAQQIARTKKQRGTDRRATVPF